MPNANPAGTTPYEKDLYFYHPDHLGSSSYVTDLNAKLYEHLEYFPFGEGWIEENSNVQRTPYLFTAKELDEETGLYYFGARYYDPRTSVWQSGDPILEKYLPNAPTKPEEVVKLLPPTVQQPLARFSLPGMGGVYNPINLALYSYAAQNPVRYVDPDGKENKEEWEFKPKIDVKPDLADRTVRLESVGAKITYKRTQTQQETATSTTDPVPTSPPSVPEGMTLPKVPSKTEVAKEIWKLIKGDVSVSPPPAPGQPQTRSVVKSSFEASLSVQVNSGLEYNVSQGEFSGRPVTGGELRLELKWRF